LLVKSAFDTYNYPTDKCSGDDTVKPPFQVCEEYFDTPLFEALLESIKEVGVLQAIEIDSETGEILNGHHRMKCIEILGIKDYPVVVRANIGNDADKRTYARKVNCQQRTLNTSQKQHLIKDQLLDTPEYSDRRIATIIGVTNKTVASIRKELQNESGEIPHFDTRIDSKGVERPASRPISVYNPTAREKALLKNEAVIADMIASGSKSPVNAMRKINIAKKYSVTEADVDIPIEHYRIFQGDLMTGLPKIQDKCIDLLFCDPFYDEGSLPQLKKISEIALRVLKDDGNLLVLHGGYYMAEAIKMLTSHMELHWTLCWSTPKAAPRNMRGVATRWKPLYWLRKPNTPYDTSADNFIINDIITPTDELDKSSHPNAQDIGGCIQVVNMFTKPGAIVLDVCCGGGSSAVACAVRGRRYIGIDIEEKYVEITKQRVKQVFDNKHAIDKNLDSSTTTLQNP